MDALFLYHGKKSTKVQLCTRTDEGYAGILNTHSGREFSPLMWYIVSGFNEYVLET